MSRTHEDDKVCYHCGHKGLWSRELIGDDIAYECDECGASWQRGWPEDNLMQHTAINTEIRGWKEQYEHAWGAVVRITQERDEAQKKLHDKLNDLVNNHPI